LRGRTLALAGVSAAYLALAIPSSLMIPAWEANDEAEHVLYVQRIVVHRQIPYIHAVNGHEAHQPPLFYAAASLWQRALGIDAFEPRLHVLPQPPPTTVTPDTPTRTLILGHDYDSEQRTNAINVHILRALSILFGLGTVVLTYASARIAFAREDVAVAAGAFVAFLPKFQVVSATFTNDSLVIALSALALVLLLLLLRGLPPVAAAYGAFGVGAVVGAAFITKLNAAVLIPVVAVVILLARAPLRHRALYAALATAGFALVSSWWFRRNHLLYDDLLAHDISLDYLRPLIPGLVDPVPIWDADRFLYFLPQNLFRSAWYTGGWNQFVGPFAANFLLWLLVGIAVFAWARALLAGPREPGWTIARREALCLSVAALAGLIAVVLVARDTLQAEGRVAYVGLSAFAIVAVAGLEQAVGGSRRARTVALATFPSLLLAYEVYVLARYVIPFRGL
jgi:4-amino-4-deoxy-L-arabinose transferase-like glycosyltransferase